MTEYGYETSIYMERNLVKLVDEVVEEHPYEFPSRSAFIKAATAVLLRKFGKLSKHINQ